MARPSTRAANDSGDDLWLVPPDRFVAVRNALAKRTGDAEVRKLKRPSPSAWVVNVLVHTSPKEVAGVFAAGDALHTAQGRVLAGEDPSELHDAMRKVRDAVGHAWKRARTILTESDRKPTADLTRRVTQTLRSAAIDKRLRLLVERGELVADPSNDDLAALADVKVSRRTKKKSEPKKKLEPKKKPELKKRDNGAAERKKAAAVEAREHAKRERTRIAREATERLRAEALQAEAAVEDARRAVMHAEGEERRARAVWTDAERSVTTARAALKKAKDAHKRAQKRGSPRRAPSK